MKNQINQDLHLAEQKAIANELRKKFFNQQSNNQMKKQIIKIGILMSAGFFGAVASMYFVFDTQVPMGLIASYFLTSVGLIGVAFSWLDKVLSNNLK